MRGWWTVKQEFLLSSPKMTRTGSLSKPPASWNYTPGREPASLNVRGTDTHTRKHTKCEQIWNITWFAWLIGLWFLSYAPVRKPLSLLQKGRMKKVSSSHVSHIIKCWKTPDSIQEGKALSLHSRQRQTKQTVSFLSYSSQIPGSFFCKTVSKLEGNLSLFEAAKGSCGCKPKPQLRW